MKKELQKYAYSIKTSRIREKDFPYSGEQITGTNDLARFCSILQEADI